MNEILDICKRAKAVCGELLRLDSRAKFEILNAVADELLAQKEAIKAANAKDLASGEKSGLSLALLDRLRLTDACIEAMTKGVREVAGFAEVVGENLGGWSHPNGMKFIALNDKEEPTEEWTVYSIGGGALSEGKASDDFFSTKMALFCIQNFATSFNNLTTTLSTTSFATTSR